MATVDEALAAQEPAAPSTEPKYGVGSLAAILPPCWLCNDRCDQCAKPDCPRVWRLKDPLSLMVEGKAK
jgi:hypothetical protein